MPRRHEHRRRSPANRVRIIGGKWRGRKLDVAGDGVRPTPDRVRVTLFNWLAPRLRGTRVLDLFAGTGALGLEALSRGAEHGTFVEQNRAAARWLRAQCERLDAHATVVQADALRWLGRLPPSMRWDVVFLDPPFGSPLLDAALVASAARLTAAGLVYVESDAAFDFADPTRLSGLEPLRVARAGAVCYGLLRGPRGS